MDAAVTISDLDWTKLEAVVRTEHPVLPVAVQDADDGSVLMVAYVTVDALRETYRRGHAVFFSTSTGRLHWKGETSGDHLELVDISVNCESNSLLMRVRQLGAGSCHVRDDAGRPEVTCFHRPLAPVA